MASLEEDIEATATTVLRNGPWPRVTSLGERLAEAKHAPEAFRVELKEARQLLDAE